MALDILALKDLKDLLERVVIRHFWEILGPLAYLGTQEFQGIMDFQEKKVLVQCIETQTELHDEENMYVFGLICAPPLFLFNVEYYGHGAFPQQSSSSFLSKPRERIEMEQDTITAVLILCA